MPDILDPGSSLKTIKSRSPFVIIIFIGATGRSAVHLIDSYSVIHRTDCTSPFVIIIFIDALLVNAVEQPFPEVVGLAVHYPSLKLFIAVDHLYGDTQSSAGIESSPSSSSIDSSSLALSLSSSSNRHPNHHAVAAARSKCRDTFQVMAAPLCSTPCGGCCHPFKVIIKSSSS